MTVAAIGCCHYCGRATLGFACHAHRDLPAVDPVFSPDVPQRNSKPAEDVFLDALLDGLDRKEQ